MNALQASVNIKVPFFDVDSMRIAWHGHYVKYFEIARCQLLDNIGHGYQNMFDSGHAWPIVDLRIRYMRPLRFDQNVQVVANLRQWDHRLRITYRVLDIDSGGCLARGSTVQAPVDMSTGELCLETPPRVAAMLKAKNIVPPDNVHLHD